MSSGYNTFTNQEYGAEGRPWDVPPSYEKAPPGYSSQQASTSEHQQLVTCSPGPQAVTHLATVRIPKDHFTLALLVTIFCFLPFGIAGLVKSSEVKSRASAGDYEGAIISSSEAKRWSKIGLILGSVLWVSGITFKLLDIFLI